MAKRFKAITPDENFNGKTCGVKFENGMAIFDDYTLKEISHVDSTAADVADAMRKDFGYKVEELKEK
jgi:hypothetical protein